MFINNINPTLLSLGPFSIRYYGLVYAIGFLAAYFYLRWLVKKKFLKMTGQQLDSYFLWLVIGAIVGARLFEVFVYSLPYYMNHMSEAWQIWLGGMSFHGGLIGSIVVTLIFAKKHKLSFYDIMDVLVIPATFALMVGRIANYTNSELYGTITNPQSTPWCVVFQRVDNYCRHPAQLYEALDNLVMAVILILYKNHHARQSNKNYKKGMLFWLFMLLYGLFRFFITFYRDEVKYFGLNVGQWLCAIMVIMALYFIYRIQTQHAIHPKSKNI